MNKNLLITVLASQVGLSAVTPNASWVVQKQGQSLTACRTTLKAFDSNNASFDVVVEIAYASGDNKTASFNVILSNASKFKNLNLNDFDPWGPKPKYKTFELLEKSKNKAFRFYAEGSNTTESSSDEFSFNISTREKNSQLHKFLEEAFKSKSEWIITITSPVDKHKYIKIPLDFDGAHDFIDKIVL